MTRRWPGTTWRLALSRRTDGVGDDGVVLTIEEIVAQEIFPFTGDLQVKPLEPRVIPEPPRHDTDPAECGSCSRPDSEFIWTDERWRVQALLPTPVPGVVLLHTRAHHDSFTDMSPDLLGQMGPMIARMERAVESIGEVGRVHLNRWGDGGAHFHLWFIPRPLGALQLRGSCLPMWFDVLPDLDGEASEAPLGMIAEALSTDGGTAHPSTGWLR
jgi:diadenosine tetraphosphate (Ap4A) HIT family hydrolase